MTLTIQKMSGGYMHCIALDEKIVKRLTAGNNKRVVCMINKTITLHVPEEFTEVFATDPESEKMFSTLTDGNKRGLITLANMAKSGDKKIERALKIAER
jgi:uncharacterized protein YdeI (YjbR/CyaY-like superfamily)